MKIRKERSGLHLFDRVSGLHILMDEIIIPKDQIALAPRTVSVAITNRCNCKCDFCYADKNDHTLSKKFILDLANKLDKLGTFEMTFGGGEPFLHPELLSICEWIWNNTKLGISITTNGHYLTPDIVDKMKNYISSIRVSIDSIEPEYSLHRNMSLATLLNNIRRLEKNVPYGINIIYRPGKASVVREIIDIVTNIGAANVLIIPEHVNGAFILSPDDWRELESMVSEYNKQIQLYVTYNAAKHIKVPFLETEEIDEFLFAHVSADKRLKKNSYDNEGIFISDITNLESYLFNISREG